MRKRVSLILLWDNSHIHFFSIIIKKHTHISFSVILAGILRAGKKHFLGNLVVRLDAECALLSQIVAWRMHSANPSNFSRENISCLPRRVFYHVSIFYVNQTDSVLNFARGQTPADDTCVY